MMNYGDGWNTDNGTYGGWGNTGYWNPGYGNQGFGGNYGGYGGQNFGGPGYDNGGYGSYGNQNFGGGYGGYGGNSGWGYGSYGNYGNQGFGGTGYGYGAGPGFYGGPGVTEVDYFVFLTPQQHAQAAQKHAGMAQQHAQAAQQHAQAAQQGGGQSQTRQTGQMSDSQIEQNVNNALDNTPSISTSDIQAKVDNGVVTLTGTVRSKNVKQSADNIAWNCPGVQDVQNNITVQSRAQKSGTKASSGSTSSQSKTPATAGAGS